MNFRALAKRLGLTVGNSISDAQIKALVCQRLRLAETAPVSDFRKAASEAGVKADFVVLARRVPEAARAALGGADVELLIYGDIGENWYGDGVVGAEVVRALAGLAAMHILVRISSYGGNVKDGVEIHNALRAHGAKITTRIEAVAASIASVIAMAGDTVEAYANTLFMAHAPWTVVAGNAQAMREAAEMLDAHAKIIAASYARKTGRSVDDEMAAVLDGKDHWFTAEEAKSAGYVDALLGEAAPEDPAAAALIERPLAGVRHRFTNAPAAQAATHCGRGSAAIPVQAASRPHQPLEVSMLRALAKSLGITVTAEMSDDAIRAAIANKLNVAATATDDELITAARSFAGATPLTTTAAEPTRDQQIDQILAVAAHGLDGADLKRVQNIAKRAKLNPTDALATVREQMVAAIGNEAQPAAGSHVSAGDDQRDKIVLAASNALLVRAAVKTAKPIDLAGNPFAQHTLADLCRGSLERAGINTRNMGRNEVIAKVLSMQTTSDFPIILENTMHRAVLAGAASVAPIYRRIAKIVSLSDYRPSYWYRPGSIGDLQEKNEQGEFKTGTLGDGERESLQAKNKGLIIALTREAMINDDLGFFSNVAFGLGQSTERTIDKALIALFSLNSGDGPTLGDGKAMFHADHDNDTSVSAVVDTPSVDRAITLMAQQQNVGANDFLDIRPSIWLGPISLRGQARVVNESEREVSGGKNLTTPNYVASTFGDIVDTPRLGNGAWYTLASPDIEPAFAVGFLDGQQAVQIATEESFGSAGFAYRAMSDHGTAGVGYRGITRTKTA